ncbi:MAG: PQQ-binding-like beta-propeller repeat protein [Planctomycetes bacterium]|nr:PQQ-binding-like beta-propeller repeat protein [Planctomycetota bacterium]
MTQTGHSDKPSGAIRAARAAARAVAVVAAVFSLSVCIVIIANYFQTRAAAPMDSPALKHLTGELRDRPGDDALKEEIRALDLLVRKAFFTSERFRRIGAYLLLGGVAVMLVSLKTAGALGRKLPDPGRFTDADESQDAQRLIRWLVGALGVALAVSSLIIAFSSADGLTPSRIAQVTEEPRQSPQAPEAAAGMPTREEILANWPSFRGPDGNAVAYCTDIPTDWDGPGSRGILWKTALPRPGFSSPVVWGKRVFLTGADENVQEVYCFDADTGNILWQRKVAAVPGSPAEPPEVTPDTGYAAPTTATDGRRVFAIFATGDVACLDFDGSRIWARNLGVPENHYGHASSLITYENLLLVQFDHGGGGHLLGLDVATGRTVWETEREVDTSWASPIVVDTGNRKEAILCASPLVAAYNPKTGVRLWSIDCLGGEVGPSPAYGSGRVFAGNEFAVLAAISMDTLEVVWETQDDLPEVSSPLAVGDYLFVATSGGTVTCFEAATGKVLWQQEFEDGFYSSPILAGGLVYLMDTSGVMHIFKAAGEFKPIGSPKLAEKSTCTPAFVNGRIYIRGDEHLYCIGKTAGGAG